jgi:hypothetical protein
VEHRFSVGLEGREAAEPETQQRVLGRAVAAREQLEMPLAVMAPTA